jgi:hypothetical protein
MNHQTPCSFTLLCAVVIAGLIGGCSSGPKLPCPEPGEETASSSPGEEYVAFTVQNETCMSLCVLLISPDHCEYMGGVNYLEGNPLRSEESVTLSIPPGKYAAWVELCTEEYRADERLRVNSDYTHEVIDPAPGSKPPCGTSISVVNESPVAVCDLRIGVTESVYTGWNWVGDQHIQPGESVVLTLRPDTYFIRAEACDGTWLRSEVDVKISGHQIWTVP